MKRVFIHILCFVVTLASGVSISLFLNLLRLHGGDIPVLVIVEDARSITPQALPKSSSDPRIRNVDFANFTYPSQSMNQAGAFKMRNGEVLPKRKDKFGRPLDVWLTLVDVTYGDVTGDGREDAIVNLSCITGGSAIPNLIYIYGSRKGRPKLLWKFETGDRADGGYKNVFAENGQLVVELLGKDKIVGRNLYEDDGTKKGDCCPTYFTRTRYEWAGNQFRHIGESEVLPLDR